MPQLIDISGKRFGRLVVMNHLGRRHNSSLWMCQCDCGAKIEATKVHLDHKQRQSCGCFRRDRMAQLTYKHGERGGESRPSISLEYRCWSRMLDRCNRPTESTYKWYGGRGIRVCKEWTEDFGAFLRDLGRKPTRYHTLDRINSNGHYEPGNCRWATQKQQARNRSNNRVVQFRGHSVTLVEAAEMAGLHYGTVKARICSHGWSVERALSEPIRHKMAVIEKQSKKFKTIKGIQT